VNAVGTQKVVTIEALAENGVLTKIQKAWVELDVPQCGYCQSGMVMAVDGAARRQAQSDRRRTSTRR